MRAERYTWCLVASTTRCLGCPPLGHIRAGIGQQARALEASGLELVGECLIELRATDVLHPEDSHALPLMLLTHSVLETLLFALCLPAPEPSCTRGRRFW